MTWNWQQTDWPNFTYDRGMIEPLELDFQRQAGTTFGALKYLATEDKDQLTVELICEEAFKTSQIEGEMLNRDSLQSSILRQFGLQHKSTTSSAAEQGIAEMMVDLYRNYQLSLSKNQLSSWHKMVVAGRQDLENIGTYRTHSEAMQIISGAIGKQKVHFEAPPSNSLPTEMQNYISWFNATAPAGDSPLPPLLRAGMAHLYFECIHPFEDGNGRIGRAIAEKALAQCLGQPTLIALAYMIEKKRKNYYLALEQANQSNEITPWLIYFAELVISAQAHTIRLIEFLILKTKLYDRLRGQLNERQKKVIARMFAEGIDGFKGGLSAENYISITKTSRATATRDLQNLVAKEALVKTGERKFTRYHLVIDTDEFEPRKKS